MNTYKVLDRLKRSYSVQADYITEKENTVFFYVKGPTDYGMQPPTPILVATAFQPTMVKLKTEESKTVDHDSEILITAKMKLNGTTYTR